MMKIYIHDKGVLFVGKAWEIREKIKYYRKFYPYLADWLKNEPPK